MGNPANFWSVSALRRKEQQDTAMKYLNEAMYDDTYVDSLVQNGGVPVTTDAECSWRRLSRRRSSPSPTT